MHQVAEEGLAFDSYANQYDEQEKGNEIKARLRRRSLATLHATFQRPSRLLEIGAGTGTEAVAMAQAGHEVVATDPSPAMIRALREKALRAGVHIETHVLPARDVACLQGPFDGAFCSFGGLNLERDLAPVARALAGLVRPGGAFVTSTMTRWALVQAVGGMVVLRPRQAWVRLGGKAWFQPDPSRPPLPVYYPTVRNLRRSFAPWFHMESLRALNLFLPGPGAWRRVRTMPRLLDVASRLDQLLGGARIVRNWGDHTVMVFRRRNGAPTGRDL